MPGVQGEGEVNAVKMKVIQVDNFDREGPGHDDRLVVGGLTEEIAQKIADLLNDEHSGESSPVFYRAVPNDYVLKKWEP